MSGEFAFIDALRAIATDPAARGLSDDAAVLPLGHGQLVLTMDTIVEGVHFLPDDPPETVAWKLVAVNASDLSAKGAGPLGCLTSHALGAPEWDARFVEGLGLACRHFGLPVLGGDTVRMPQGSARSFSLTALGLVEGGVPVPSRSGRRPGTGCGSRGHWETLGYGWVIALASMVSTPPRPRTCPKRCAKPIAARRPTVASDLPLPRMSAR